MRRADAPPPGWYPNPEGGARLRWWDGEDWTDRYRAPPSPSEVDIAGLGYHGARATATRTPPQQSAPVRTAIGERRADTEEIIAQVRQIARSEIDRAANLFSERAAAATREIRPLVSEYTNKLLRWLRIIVVVAIVLLAFWVVFQAIVQVSFFEWIGDRIDNITAGSEPIVSATTVLR